MSRRQVLRTGLLGAGAVLLAPRVGLGGLKQAPAPVSRLFPDEGTRLIESDLHNHSLMSDGAGAAEEAFQMMRSAGLDVGALTDHASTNKHGRKLDRCTDLCGAATGLDEEGWETQRVLADAAYEPGAFVATRGFEWTTLAIGHLNVWFSEKWIDGLTAGGLGSYREVEWLLEQQEQTRALGEQARPVGYTLPTVGSVQGFYDWLAAPVNRPVLGGGSDAIAGFNHPHLYGNFEDFQFDPRVVDRVVSLEMFSFGRRDYLFEGREHNKVNPLTQCLDAGWRVGLLGVSDEHGSTYGRARGRGGLWVHELSREGVREALLARRFFAASEPGLHLDAAANGVRMGRSVPFQSGTVDIDLDLQFRDGGTAPVLVQILRTGEPMPEIVETFETQVGAPEPVRLSVEHDVVDGRWLVVRVTDPSRAPHGQATGEYATAGAAIAYASPFFLDPDAPGA